MNDTTPRASAGRRLSLAAVIAGVFLIVVMTAYVVMLVHFTLPVLAARAVRELFDPGSCGSDGAGSCGYGDTAFCAFALAPVVLALVALVGETTSRIGRRRRHLEQQAGGVARPRSTPGGPRGPGGEFPPKGTRLQ